MLAGSFGVLPLIALTNSGFLCLPLAQRSPPAPVPDDRQLEAHEAAGSQRQICHSSLCRPVCPGLPLLPWRRLGLFSWCFVLVISRSQRSGDGPRSQGHA